MCRLNLWLSHFRIPCVVFVLWILTPPLLLVPFLFSRKCQTIPTFQRS